MGSSIKLLGIDPGLHNTGWGVIRVVDSRLSFIAAGTVHTDTTLSLAQRLSQIYDGIAKTIVMYKPTEAAVEETFVNKNPTSTLKLGQARGIALLCPARAGLMVVEYPPNLIKKTVVGTGHAAKGQVQAMVRVLLPGCDPPSIDAADALAVAICHAHHRSNIQSSFNIATRKIARGGAK